MDDRCGKPWATVSPADGTVEAGQVSPQPDISPTRVMRLASGAMLLDRHPHLYLRALREAEHRSTE
jgi:hypothetical protein